MRPSPSLRLLLGILAGTVSLLLALGPASGVATAKQRKGSASKPRLGVDKGRRVSRALSSSSSRCEADLRARLSRTTTRRLRREVRRAQRRGRARAARRLRRRLRRKHRRQRATASRSCNRRKKVNPSPSSIYWGAWISKQLTGTEAPWDMNAVEKFEAMAGKDASIVHFGSPFANCYSECYFYDFPTNPMEDVREHGSIPFLSWSSQSIPSSRVQPDYQLSDVVAGRYDDYIREYASDAAEWGHPFFLRFNWEMNGDWFSWGAGANGNSAADSVAAWRHVHDIFASVGATNATWVWCPNVDPGDRMVDLASLYPGGEYVDWTCLDGYNWGTNPNSPNSWASFDKLYRSTYDEVIGEIAPGKPMIVGEVGASEYGGSKADWIADMLEKVPTEYPGIRGLLYFEKFDDGMDWPIETSASATAAFAAGIGNPAFATNSFANLGGGPIAPPAG